MSYEENLDDFWQDELVIEAKIDFDKTKTLICHDEFGCSDFVSISFPGNIKMRIPTLKFWQREPFYYEQDQEDVDDILNERITSRVKLVPVKRVRIIEL